jgi:hypothetical protein
MFSCFRYRSATHPGNSLNFRLPDRATGNIIAARFLHREVMSRICSRAGLATANRSAPLASALGL